MQERYVPTAGAGLLREFLPGLLHMSQASSPAEVRCDPDGAIWVQWLDGWTAHEVREVIAERPFLVSREGIAWRVPPVRLARELSLRGAVSAVLGGVGRAEVLLSVRGSAGSHRWDIAQHWDEAQTLLEVALGCFETSPTPRVRERDVPSELAKWRDGAPMHNHHREVRRWLVDEGLDLARDALTLV